MTNPLRRKAVENAIVKILREQPDVELNLKSIRPLVAELLDGCAPPDLAAAVQSLRYAGKLVWNRLELSDGMKRTSAASLSVAEQEGGAAPDEAAPHSDRESAVIPVAAPGPELGLGRLSSGPDISVSARQGDQNPLELDAPKGPAEAQGSGADEAGPDDDDNDPGTVNDRITGHDLYVELLAAGEKRGLKPTQISKIVFGHTAQMCLMRSSSKPVRRRTQEKARAWLSSLGEIVDEAREGPQAEQGPEGREPLSAEGAPGDGPARLREEQREVQGRRLEEPRRDPALDQSAGPGTTLEPWKEGFRKAGTAGGRHAASTRAGFRSVPAPQHEPELARSVREEVNESADRRRRASSTATVRQPLELRKFRVPDMSIGERVTSLLAESPGDLMAAIGRRHPALWRRVILLGRAIDMRTAQALYLALERGLNELEAGLPPETQGEIKNAA